VPDLFHLRGAGLERGEATLDETGLAFHESTLALAPNRSLQAAPELPSARCRNVRTSRAWRIVPCLNSRRTTRTIAHGSI
jgi:hypothetical protein